MSAGLFAFNVTAPGNGNVVLVENEEADGPYGGLLVLRAAGAVNLLVGGNDQNCVLPLNTTDTESLVLSGLRETDQVYVKIATGSSPGTLAVLKQIV